MLTRPFPWFLFVAIWYAVLLYLSSQSQLEAPGPEFMHRDKVMHLTYFAIGGICFYLALRFWRPTFTTARVCLFVILFCTTVGALDEFRQSFTPDRSGNDIGDWIADTLGGLLACLIAPHLITILKKIPLLSR